MDFCMYLNVQFNRAIDRKRDYLSPGGFKMTMGGKLIAFDFEDSYGNVDDEDSAVVNFCLENPDYKVFPDLLLVKESDLENVTDISECYVYTGEEEETDLEVKKILQIAFELHDGRKFKVPTEVLAKYNAGLTKKEA